MYLALPDHRKHVIKDLYTVWLPPIPQRNQIHGWELKKSDQMWRRQPLPKFYEERREEERYQQAKEEELVLEGVMKQVQHYDDVLERYRRQQWEYRMKGYWVMINGEPIYLTGAHWMYLQWTKLDHVDNDGYPIFYWPQLDRYYFRALCVEDPYCLGYLIIGPRGFGKTAEESGFGMDFMSRPPHRRHFAIQSKSESDAKEVVFQEKMVPIFNEYPEFFKPQYSHGTNPSSRMVFRRKSQTGASAKKNAQFGDQYELNNTIKTFPAKEKAVDGKTLAGVISDEIGKTNPREEADVYERHAVHVKCVFRNQRKTGIIQATSSVEQMDEGGDECYEVWLESNPNERDGNGMTASKVYKYLVTGMECKTQIADQYGKIDPVEAEQIIDNERRPFLNDPYKLSLVMRKDPKNEEEAFIKDQAKSLFNTFIIANSISRLKKINLDLKKKGLAEKKEPDGRQVRLSWKDGKVDSEVEWEDDPDGLITIFFMPDAIRQGGRKIINACEYYIDGEKKMWLPCNNEFYRAGGDPVRYLKTDDPQASKTSVFGYMFYDANYDHGKPESEWISDNMFWQFFGRSEDPEDDYEQVIMALRLFGHSIMMESNVSDFAHHLQIRGYGHFIIVRKNFSPDVLSQKKTRNTLAGEQSPAATHEVIDSWVSLIKRWWKKKGHRNKSLVLAEQCRDFELKKRTKFDAVPGWGFTLLSLKAEIEDHIKSLVWAQKPESLFKMYNISGNRSRAIEQGDGKEAHEDFSPAFLDRLLTDVDGTKQRNIIPESLRQPGDKEG